LSKKLRNGRNTGDARHVRLYRWMLGTAAWQSLGAIERAVYLDILARYGGPGSNNGRIPYSIREAADALSIGKTRAAEALATLKDRGFIVASREGTPSTGRSGTQPSGA
jgi:hypothetical protein